MAHKLAPLFENCCIKVRKELDGVNKYFLYNF